MTVDPNYARGLAGAIGQVSATEQRLTTELSSGLRVTQLSDDAVAVAQNVGLSSTVSRLDSFVKSSTAEQSRMQVADSALGDVVSQLTSAISLAVEAGNGTLSAQDLKGIQSQVSSIRDNVLALGNTSYEGHFVFGGSQGTTPPFTLNTSADPAVASYHGDTVVQTIRTPDGQSVPVNVAGSSVLQSAGADVLATLNQLVSDLSMAAGGTGSTATLQADSSALTHALGSVTGQRAGLDSALNRLTSASGYAQTESTVFQAQQSRLLSADPAAVATDLKTSEVQQQALYAVTAALEGAQDLFGYLK